MGKDHQEVYLMTDAVMRFDENGNITSMEVLIPENYTVRTIKEGTKESNEIKLEEEIDSYEKRYEELKEMFSKNEVYLKDVRWPAAGLALITEDKDRIILMGENDPPNRLTIISSPGKSWYEFKRPSVTAYKEGIKNIGIYDSWKNEILIPVYEGISEHFDQILGNMLISEKFNQIDLNKINFDQIYGQILDKIDEFDRPDVKNLYKTIEDIANKHKETLGVKDAKCGLLYTKKFEDSRKKVSICKTMKMSRRSLRKDILNVVYPAAINIGPRNRIYLVDVIVLPFKNFSRYKIFNGKGSGNFFILPLEEALNAWNGKRYKVGVITPDGKTRWEIWNIPTSPCADAAIENIRMEKSDKDIIFNGLVKWAVKIQSERREN